VKLVDWFIPMKKRNSDVEDVMEGNGWEHYFWGKVEEVHRIGDYGVIQYVCNHGKEDGNVYFHPVLWTGQYKEHHGNQWYWEDTNMSYPSLESALVGVIAYKYDGLNSQAASYFCKMIGLK